MTLQDNIEFVLDIFMNDILISFFVLLHETSKLGCYEELTGNPVLGLFLYALTFLFNLQSWRVGMDSLLRW